MCLEAPHRENTQQTSTTDEYKGDEQEFYYPEVESMNVNNTFKKNSQVRKRAKQLQHDREESQEWSVG